MRPTRLALTLLLTAVLALVCAAPPAVAAAPLACRGAGQAPSQASIAAVRGATLCLLNRERAQRGLGALRSNRSLRAAASRYAARMSRQDFFAHVAPDGSSMVDRIRRTAYLRGAVRRWTVGENLAWGAGRRATPAQTVAAWMASPGHKANILALGFAEIGIGVTLGAPVPGQSNAATYVTNFGARIR
jgi:uncharacterized protein YkwD